jgi:hypothetical protein
MAPRKRRLEFDTYGSHEAASRNVQAPPQLERHTHYEPLQAGEDSFYEIPTFNKTVDTALLPEGDDTEFPMLEDDNTYNCGGDDDTYNCGSDDENIDFYGVDPSELEALGLLSIADQISLGETGGESHKPRRTRTQAVGCPL